MLDPNRIDLDEQPSEYAVTWRDWVREGVELALLLWSAAVVFFSLYAFGLGLSPASAHLSHWFNLLVKEARRVF